MPGPPACGRGPTRYIHVDMYMYLHRAPSVNTSKLCHPRWYVEQPREAILETYSRIDARDHDHGDTRTPSSAIHTQKVNPRTQRHSAPTRLRFGSSRSASASLHHHHTAAAMARSLTVRPTPDAPLAVPMRSAARSCSTGPRVAAAASPPIWSLTCSFALAAATQLSIATPGA